MLEGASSMRNVAFSYMLTISLSIYVEEEFPVLVRSHAHATIAKENTRTAKIIRKEQIETCY